MEIKADVAIFSVLTIMLVSLMIVMIFENDDSYCSEKRMACFDRTTTYMWSGKMMLPVTHSDEVDCRGEFDSRKEVCIE